MPSSALSLQASDPKVEKLAGPEVRKFAIRIIDKKWQAAGPRSQRLLSYGNPWRSLGDSNPCFRRERATSWAARRRELSLDQVASIPQACKRWRNALGRMLARRLHSVPALAGCPVQTAPAPEAAQAIHSSARSAGHHLAW